MKKYIKIFLALFIAATCYLSSGCKKSDTSSINYNLVKAYVLNSNFRGVIDSGSYTYDNQGRVLTQSGIVGTATYFYGANSIVYTPAPYAFPPAVGYTATLNSQGLEVSNSNGISYTYDNNGYNLTQTNTHTSATTYYTISNGNIVSDSSASQAIYRSYTFQSALDNRDFGQPYLGKRNKNIINVETVFTPDNQVQVTTDTVTYTLDSRNRISTQTYSYSTGDQLSYTYTYVYQ